MLFTCKSCCGSVRMFGVRNFASNRQSSIRYCIDSVKQFDYENYLSTLLLTSSLRHGAFIIRAFNIEVSRVQDQVSDKKIGLMRLQFWSDTLDKIFSPPDDIFPAHPVAVELRNICRTHSLSKYYLGRIINCRKNNISKSYYNSIEEMEKYSEESVSPVYFLLLEIAGFKNVNYDHAASHLGKAQGLTNIIRSVEVLSKKRQTMLPLDLLIKHNVSQENVLRLKDSQGLRDVVFECATRANQHLTKARNIEVPSKVKSILLPAVAVDSYLKRLQQYDFNLFDKRVKDRNNFLPLHLYWNKFRSQF